jgi:KDO2-lipid IV(A) lauroyltransferase
VSWFARPWHLLLAGIVHTLLFAFRVIPARLSLAAASGIASFLFLVLRARRNAAIQNVLASGITTDPREARRLAKEAFHGFVLVVVESTLVRQRMTADNWRDFVTLHIPPEAEELLAREDQGVLVAAGHMGNWEVAARAVSFMKPVCAIYRPFNNPYLESSLNSSRAGQRLRLISKYATDPLRFAKALKDGEVLAIMIDQHARGGIYVDFFGRPAKTTPTVALLHLVTRTPVIVTCTIRTGPLRYEVHGVGPLAFERTGNRTEDVRNITQALTSEIETLARRWPEQYMWGHRRWK